MQIVAGVLVVLVSLALGSSTIALLGLPWAAIAVHKGSRATVLRHSLWWGLLVAAILAMAVNQVVGLGSTTAGLVLLGAVVVSAGLGLVAFRSVQPAQVRQLSLSSWILIGAVVTFTGLVRDMNPYAGDGSAVATLTLEHYPGMTEKSIDQILAQAVDRWPLLEVSVVHRVGTMAPTAQIVWVGVASAHRDAAFAAAEFVMDYLKTQAVFWKKEQSQRGSHWVESTVQDHQRARSW